MEPPGRRCTPSLIVGGARPGRKQRLPDTELAHFVQNAHPVPTARRGPPSNPWTASERDIEIERPIMKRVTTAEIRRNMAELVNRAAYGGERFVVTRHGKGVAALVPLEDAALLERMRTRLAERD